MSAIAKQSEQRVARPLKVLVPLIQDDLKHGREAAERAGFPYYQSAGEKMLEARPQCGNYQEFVDWAKRNFGIGKDTAGYYMKLAEATANNHSSALESKSLSDFIRQTSNPNYNKPPAAPAWKEQVERIVERVDTEALNIKREEMKRADERDVQRELALQLIDIGYKVLAKELHPDKGGSRDAMSRLNIVRDRLKQHV